ncbi:peptidoglycan-binding domain-containing protein [Chelativorans alearense]|uniref:peptidoglycan-binding domain-containing protein n=1 Tax=Chelativorans alearense TaxID=2681495 RepID=UPI0013D0CDF5|nr:peptidoglycan-binding protein [Chelativorans alearense]
MTRYARRPEHGGDEGGWLRAGLSGLGAVVARNPAAVGGTTAFFVSLAFVSANALWYQPQVHPSAFVSTRAPAFTAAPAPEIAPEETPRPAAAPREEVRAVTDGEGAPKVEAEPAPESTGSVAEDSGDATVRSVQRVLSDLGLYRGPVDGLTGPQTRGAVENYRRIVGLEPSTEIDSPLLSQLGLEGPAATVEAAVPAPKPAPRPREQSDPVQTASLDGGAVAAAGGDPVIKRVQAGLKAFGNDGIEVDGVMGENTRSAIREFQSLFGLPVTGEPDQAFLAKMREIGLTN